MPLVVLDDNASIAFALDPTCVEHNEYELPYEKFIPKVILFSS